MNLEYGLFPKRHPMPWESTKPVELGEKPIGQPMRKCLHCGKTFQPLEARTKCCSVSCGVKHSKRVVRHGTTRHYKTPMLVDAKRCAVCDGVFSPKNGKQLYCDQDCYKIAKYEKAKLYKEKQK
jgi:hypothetical protein